MVQIPAISYLVELQAGITMGTLNGYPQQHLWISTLVGGGKERRKDGGRKRPDREGRGERAEKEGER